MEAISARGAEIKGVIAAGGRALNIMNVATLGPGEFKKRFSSKLQK